MKNYKVYTFDEVVDESIMREEAWEGVKIASREEYKEEYRREIKWPEGFLDKLKGKSLEEQMEFYRIVKTEFRSKTAYGEITKENKSEFGYSLDEYSGLKALIVEDDILIGVRINSAFDRLGVGSVAFPYENICTYYDSENNGSGYNDTEEYAHLCCVMPE